MGKRLTGSLAMLLGLVVILVPLTLPRVTPFESAITLLSGVAVSLFGVAVILAAARHR